MKASWAALAVGAVSFTLVACSPGSGIASKTGSTSPGGKVALDTSYGTNGIAPLPLNASTHDRFMAVTVAPDGKVYAAGFIIEDGDQHMAVARLDDRGGLDKTFGKDGVASVNAAVGKTVEIARSIVVQSGKILVTGPVEHNAAAAGDAARDTDVAVARFDSSGKPDASFGQNGVSVIDLGEGRITGGTTFVGDNVWGLGALPGDKVVVFGSKLADGGDRTDSDFVLVGLTNAGALDTSFGTGGRVVVDQDKSADNPRNLLVQPDGKVVATGYSTIDGVVSPVLIRTSAAGVLDSSFGKGGIATAKVLPGVAESYQVTQQGEDYVLAGYGRGADASEKVDMIVYRFKGNGTWDTSFGTNGITRVDTSKEDDRARNVVVLPDNRILAVGSGKKSALDVDAMLALFNQNGAPVSDFGDKGTLITDLGGPADAWYGVALSADKKSVIVAGYKGTEGSGNDDAVTARLTIAQ